MGYFTNDINAGGGGGVTDHGALTGKGDDDHTQYSLLSSGTGAPGTTPGRVGEIYIDTTADVSYISTGTASSADWTSTGGIPRTDEEIEDVSGAMFTGNTETLITATYQDADGTVDLVVDNDLNNYSNTTSDFLKNNSTHTLTNKTFDANGTGNSLSNVDVADLANGTDGELVTWSTAGIATTIAAGTDGHVLTAKGAGAVPVFEEAAGGGGGGAKESHKFGSDIANSASATPRYYCSEIAYVSATPSMFSGTMYFVPLIVEPGQTYTRIGAEVISVVAASTMRMGLYAADSSTGGPGTLIVDAGTIDTATSGTKEITISETLDDVRYFIGGVSDAAISVRGSHNLILPAICGQISVAGSAITHTSKTGQSAEHTSLSSTAITGSTASTTAPMRFFLRSV